MSLELKALAVAAVIGIAVSGGLFSVGQLVSAEIAAEAPPPIASTPSSASSSDLASSVTSGGQYFAASCARCHGSDGGGENDAPSLRDEDMSDADMTYMIVHGQDRMPGFASKYSPAQIKSIIAYIRTLK